MPRPKICRIITRLIVGGAQETAINLSALVDSSRYQTVLISGPQAGSEGTLLNEVEELGIHLAMEPHLVREINPLKDLLALSGLRKFIRWWRPAIVHTHSSKAGILGRLAARLEGVPILIHTVHGWSFHDQMNPLSRAAYIQLEKRMAKWTDTLIAVSSIDISKGLASGVGDEDRYRLIRSAIPIASFARAVSNQNLRREIKIPASVPLVGNVGRLSPQKNPFAFVRIAARVIQSFPDAYFVWIGDGPMKQETINLAEELGIVKRFAALGIRRDIPDLIADLDAMLITSRWEGLPKSLVEAMASGIPAVAPSIDGIREIVKSGTNGLLYPINDEAEATKAVIDLLHSKEARRRMGTAGKASVEQFDVRHMVNQTEELYKELLSCAGQDGMG